MDFARPQIYGSHSFSLWVFLNAQLTFIKSQQCQDSENRTARKSLLFYRKMPIHCLSK